MDEQQRISDVASSSNSSSKKYDVFLSFRGEDTRMNFTSLLYDALTRAKIETFIDNRLEKGDEISPALVKAIEDSHISIIIFSENYATSKWCLNELINIMELKEERRQIVILVFYNVDPTHVRHQTRSYKKAFAKHEGQPMCSKWKAALTEAANLSGWHSQNRTEADLLKDIVQDVLQKLAPTYPNQLEKLVGIGESYQEIESLLKIGSNEVITLGIWGMGGIGKTTFATALYDNLSYQFEGCCFLENVTEKSGNLKALRDELFSKLLGKKDHEFDNSDIRRLQRKKVFIVLDDVSDPEQLEKLIEEYDFLGAGSRVIVTTRDKQILSKVNKIYPVKELNSDNSLELFCMTIFGEKQPKQGYEHLPQKVISYCKGVPLALKALGANLRGRSKEAWKCELKKLQKIPNMKIHNVLKLSYDGLDRSQKDIFLDIACFLKGEERDSVTEILESFGFFAASGIEALLDKALITISHDNKIEMHDLIQEMGREIIHQESEKYPRKRSRLWKHEEVLDVLKDNKGSDDVEGIILNLDELKGDLYLSSDFLAKMTNVRFLKIYARYWWGNNFDVYLREGLESLSNKLRCLHWDRCSLNSWPPNLCAEQLVELRMRFTDVEKLWDGAQNLMNLKSIDLSFSPKLVEIPDLSKAEKLEKVSLACCYSLRQLYSSVLSLPKLTYLDLRRCTEIESLESNVRSKSLKELRLSDCSSLKKFLVTSDEIKVLDLSDTAICALSPSIGDLLSLEVLDLSGSNVESLPENIKNLSMLTRLRLERCKKLVSLPELPSSLEALLLDKCKELVSLPKLPSSLQELHLNECKELVSLPELPSSLKELRLNECKELVSLPKLPPSLQELHLNDCKELVSLPELPPSLEELHLNDRWQLKSLPELPSSLVELYLNGCKELVSLPELPLSLMELYLNNCQKLVSLPELPSSLMELYLNNCQKLVSLPELPSSLQQLHLNDCRKLMSLPELPSSLLELPLNDCRKLVSLPELPSSLREFPLNNCLKLVSLPKLPQSVERVSTFNCISLNRDITQGLLLEHMSQSLIPYLHEQYLNNPQFRDYGYFIFPGDHVTNKSGFHTAASSLTIPDLPKSDLLDFICCITFHNGRDIDVSDDSVWDEVLGDHDWGDEVSGFCGYVFIEIYQDGKQINLQPMEIEGPKNLISDHVFFSYVDISRFGSISEVCDQLSNITFKFELEYVLADSLIKGCGVFPVYATNSGLKLVGHDQENVLEYKSIAQIFDNEAQARAIGVGGSNNENEDGWEQLPTSKRQRTSP